MLLLIELSLVTRIAIIILILLVIFLLFLKTARTNECIIAVAANDDEAKLIKKEFGKIDILIIDESFDDAMDKLKAAIHDNDNVKIVVYGEYELATLILLNIENKADIHFKRRK